MYLFINNSGIFSEALGSIFINPFISRNNSSKFSNHKFCTFLKSSLELIFSNFFNNNSALTEIGLISNLILYLIFVLIFLIQNSQKKNNFFFFYKENLDIQVHL